MNKNLKVALILDDMKYLENIRVYEKIFLQYNIDVKCIITEYEDEQIRRIRKFKFLGIALQHLLYWFKSFKYAFKINKKYNIVICINPIVALFLGFLNHKNNTRVIMCGFLFEIKKNRIYTTLRKRFCNVCFKGIDKIFVYSTNEVSFYKKIFQLQKFEFIKYGIDYTEEIHYTTSKLPKTYLFSGGGSNRDYDTIYKMYDLYGESLNTEFYIATNPIKLKNLKNNNIHVLNDVILENFWHVLINAKKLVLSLKDVENSAGHMVLLQALKYNIPIIVNDISVVRDYVDEKNVVFFETGNANDLYEKITDDKKRSFNNNVFYEQNYTFVKFLERILENISKDYF